MDINKKMKNFKEIILYLFDMMIDAFIDMLKVIVRNFSLFLGTFLSISGILNFESDKYCDGNAANYLSCTRPATYYYYDWFSIALVIIGVFLIIIWTLRKSKARNLKS